MPILLWQNLFSESTGYTNILHLYYTPKFSLKCYGHIVIFAICFTWVNIFQLLFLILTHLIYSNTEYTIWISLSLLFAFFLIFLFEIRHKTCISLRLNMGTLVICLPLRETYIVFPSVYVRPSVRPSVRLSVTLSCPSHISKNPLCKKIAKIFKNNIPTEVVQQKIKIQFCQKFWKFWPKNHFLNLCFVQARSR